MAKPHLLLSLSLSIIVSLMIASPTPALASRGYSTSPEELAVIKAGFVDVREPYYANTNSFIDRLDPAEYWPYGTVSGAFQVGGGECFAVGNDQGDNFLDISEGATLVYEKVLAYQLTGNATYAAAAREKILDLTDTHTFGGEDYSGGNECILKLGLALPLWIQSADLLEGSPTWTAADKLQFQNWLATEVYKKVAWASRSRANNWGNAGSLTASMIADYLADRQGSATLAEVSPAARSLTPAQAYTEHNQLQLDRVNGVLVADAQCAVRGIQSSGGIPEELRRGATGCTGQWLVSEDSSYSYTMTAVELLLFHADYLWRRGDTRLYTATGASGTTPALKRAIYYVIANPVDASKSRTWQDARRGNLFVAYRYYRDGVILTEAEKSLTFKSGTSLPYGKLTHQFGLFENPSAPPTVAPPSGTTPTPTPTPSPTPTTTPSPACAADINQDHQVNLPDYSLLAQHFFELPLTLPRADINQDGRVDLLDYSLLVQSFFKTC